MKKTLLILPIFLIILSGCSNNLGDRTAVGVSTFLGLSDTPASFSGEATKFARVNAGETALEFIALAGGGDMLAC